MVTVAVFVFLETLLTLNDVIFTFPGLYEAADAVIGNIAIIITTGFFAGLIEGDANAIVLGLFNGLILGFLENPIIQLWWGIYAAAAYEWYFGSQIILLIILGIIFAYVGNVFFKPNIQEFSQKHLKWLLNLIN
jgi:hypothetical protein